jgi:hypothetical protein
VLKEEAMEEARGGKKDLNTLSSCQRDAKWPFQILSSGLKNTHSSKLGRMFGGQQLS